MKKLIFVLGVPRSGTSALTRAMKVFGADYGDNLLDAKVGINDKGFFENKDVFNLNEEILTSMNSSWLDLREYQLSDIPSNKLDGFLDKGREIVYALFEHNDFIVLKDPRLTKLLFFWDEVLKDIELEKYYVISLRDPTSVFESLKKQVNKMVSLEDLNESFIYYVWLDFLKACTNVLKERRSILVDYNSLIANPRDELSRVSDFLQEKINADELDEYLNSFLSKDLRHSVYTIDELRSNEHCPDCAINLYEALLKLSISDNREFDYLDKLTSIFDDHKLLLSAVNDFRFKANYYSLQLVTARDHFENDNEKQRAELKELSFLLDEKNREIRDIKENLEVIDKKYKKTISYQFEKLLKLCKVK